MKTITRILALGAGIALLPMIGIQSADAGSSKRATDRGTVCPFTKMMTRTAERTTSHVRAMTKTVTRSSHSTKR